MFARVAIPGTRHLAVKLEAGSVRFYQAESSRVRRATGHGVVYRVVRLEDVASYELTISNRTCGVVRSRSHSSASA
jgi:hypothetical protein